MGTRTKRTEAERAIIYAGVMGGLSNDRVNQLLDQVSGRPLPPTSFEWVRRKYTPYFLGDLNRLGSAIEHPPTTTQINEALLLPDSDPEGDEP